MKAAVKRPQKAIASTSVTTELLVKISINDCRHTFTVNGARKLIAQLQKAVGNAISDDEEYTAKVIIHKVAKKYNLPVQRLISKGRDEHAAWPRQVATYLCREALPESTSSKIGMLFGRDHGTILYSCKMVENRMSADAKVKSEVEALR